MSESEAIPQVKTAQSHAEAVAIFESHRKLFEHYARGSINIEPAPASLETFAFDLEKNTIYMNSMFYQQLGLSDERTVFASFHEIEHFLEKKQILAEDRGVEKFKKYLGRIKKSRAFSLTDNCVADIHVNRSVVSKTNDGMAEIEQGAYREVLFKDTDFTKSPKHIQLPQALLREARVPCEKCTVDPEVRAYLDKLQNMVGKSGRKFMDVLTDPNTTMSDRLDLQDRIIMPIVEKLKQQDIEEEKEKRKQKQLEQKEQQEKKEKEQEGGQGDPGESNPEKDEEENKPEDSNGENDKPDEGEGGDENDADNADAEGEESEGDGQKKGEKTDKLSNGKKTKSGENQEGKPEETSFEFDPNEFWKEEYEKAEKNVPNAVPIEKIEEQVKKLEEDMKDAKKREAAEREKADQEYAESLGVTKQELQNYRKYVEQIQKIVNPETGMTAIEEIRNMIARILSKRQKKKLHPKYPTEEGEFLVEPATLLSEVKAGNLQPKVWESVELKERPSNKFGEVEITLVADLSGSMDGEKCAEQLKSVVLMMEALKEFGDMCREEERNLNKPLEVRSEIFSFQSSASDTIPVKKMSAEMSETERIKTAARMSSTSGSTTDFVTLGAIESNLKKEQKEKIKIGELKKIVIVFTDGVSDDSTMVQEKLKLLRDAGVIVIGVGITEEGEPALKTYAPNARLAKKASDLSIVLADLLKEHLSDI